MRYRASVADLLTFIVAAAALVLALNRRQPPDETNPTAVASRLEQQLLGRRLGSLIGIRPGHTIPDTVDFGDGARRLLFVFRSNCPACGRTNPHWRTLASKAGVEALALTAEPTGLGEQYVQGDSVIQLHVSPESLRSWGIRLVPVTMAVSEAGDVELVEAGTLDAVEIAQVLAQVER